MASELKRLPLGIQTFSEIREGNYMYVDKTALVYEMANDNKYVFLSRPRRFGKSLLCSTLASYFEGRRELFQGLAMEHLETDWRQHPVLWFSFAAIKEGTVKDFNDKVAGRLRDYEKKWGVTPETDNLGERLRQLIMQTSERSGEKAVVIVDEYDAPMLCVLNNPERMEQMRTASRSFFGCLKDCDPYLRFVFLTGISKFSQVSIFSELNNLSKLTMLPHYSTICGFTQEELEAQMMPWVQLLADSRGTTVGVTLAELKSRYDGYHFAKDCTNIYNPYSLLNALKWQQMDDYWFDTGTPSALVNMLLKFGADITDFDDGCECGEKEFDAPTEKMVTPMPFFYQSGYLTIKDYDRDMQTYTLRYPNSEVRNGMLQALIPYYLSEPDTIKTNSVMARVFKAMRSNNLDEALQTLQAYLASVPYAENANSEGHFQTMLYVVFSALGLYVQQEVRTARGRIDMVLHMANDLYVMELKIDRPAQEALDQINRKGYLVPYTLDNRRLHKVGISFSTETRTLSEWTIE